MQNREQSRQPFIPGSLSPGSDEVIDIRLCWENSDSVFFLWPVTKFPPYCGAWVSSSVSWIGWAQRFKAVFLTCLWQEAAKSTYWRFEEQLSEAQCFRVLRTSEVAHHLHCPWALAVISKMSIILNSLCLCVCLWVGLSTWVQVPLGDQELSPSGTRVTGSCESSSGFWELNLESLTEAVQALTTGPSLPFIDATSLQSFGSSVDQSCSLPCLLEDPKKAMGGLGYCL